MTLVMVCFRPDMQWHLIMNIIIYAKSEDQVINAINFILAIWCWYVFLVWEFFFKCQSSLVIAVISLQVAYMTTTEHCLQSDAIFVFWGFLVYINNLYLIYCDYFEVKWFSFKNNTVHRHFLPLWITVTLHWIGLNDIHFQYKNGTLYFNAYILYSTRDITILIENKGAMMIHFN